jgi:hypothetical protein
MCQRATCLKLDAGRNVVAKDLESQIDALFQLPLDQFTGARNALAKESGQASVKQLAKPPVAAWAVNQLYWDRRDDYDTLVDAANEMRRTHKAVIEGKKGDLRAATREHDRAIDIALKSTLALMKERGQPVTDATRQAILNTLRALPADQPGRLTQVLSPGGLEMLAGLSPAKRTKETKSPKEDIKGTEPRVKVAPASKGADAKAAREAARQKAERDAAQRAVRDAEHEAKRMEFESARAAREVARAEKHLDAARAAIDQAREALETAERDATAAQRAMDAAVRTQESADRKARDASSRLEAARSALSGKKS